MGERDRLEAVMKRQKKGRSRSISVIVVTI